MNEQLEEQAALYVFGFIEGSEAAAFERQLQSNAELRALVDRLDETAAAIAHSAPPRTLPPELRIKVLGPISRGKDLPFPGRANWIPWAIAAGLALSCAYLLADRSQLRKRIAHLAQRDIFAQVQIATLTSKLENAPQAKAVVLWDENRQHGVLKVIQVPRNADDRDYQLWMVDPRYKNPVSGGVFHVANDGTLSIPIQPTTPVRGAQGFAISIERKGGVAKAEGPIVLLGK